MMQESVVTLLKLGLVLAVYLLCSFKIALAVCLTFTIFYRYLVAFFWGLQVIAVSDLAPFATNEQAPNNNICVVTISNADRTRVLEMFGRLVRTHPKLRCRQVILFGDRYF